MIIAIDGPAASGKGTLGKRLAAHYGLRYLDTGLLYRAVAKAMLDAGYPLDDRKRAIEVAESLDPAQLGENGLRDHAIGEATSIVAAIPEVRAALLACQRAFAQNAHGAVLDGRDIGTIVCPEAEVKLFVTASPEERARRRATELKARGERASEREILSDILRRDERDRSRVVAPLRPAVGAYVLDTTHLSIDAALEAAIAIVEKRRLDFP